MVGVGLGVFLFVSARVRVKVAWWGCGLVWVKGVWGLCVLWWVVGLLVLIGCVGVCAWLVSRFVVGVCLLGVSGARGCLGVGCVVGGGVLPSWLGGAVAGGGVGVGFGVGLRVFAFGGVSVPASGSLSAVSGPVSVSGSVVSVSPDAGVGVSGFSGGVWVCVPCAARVFGDGWCGLVLRRWARAAGVGVAKVVVLRWWAPGSGSVRSVVSGSAPSSRGGVVSSGLFSSSPSPVSGGSAFLRSLVGGGRVGVGFGARVGVWGACVGVGGGVVSGGGVVAGWWWGVVGRVRALVSGVGVKGLVLAGLVGVVVLVSVLVLVGWVIVSCARVGCVRRVWRVRAACLAGVWVVAWVWCGFVRASVVLCVRVAWVNRKGGGRGSLLVLVPSPSLFLLLWSG